MNILLAHNYYQTRGGEDVVFESERDLLKKNGQSVFEYVLNSSVIAGMGRLRTARTALWSSVAAKEVAGILRRDKIDIVHVHNTFPLISPSIYRACHQGGVPVVQTIHNYRWLCSAGTFYRDGMICTECLNTALPYPAVLHKCYHESRAHSLGAAGVQMVQRSTRVLNKHVNLFIAPTSFVKTIFPSSFISQSKIVVKPHFLLTDPGKKTVQGNHALFVGRLSEEKGTRALMNAWANLPDVPLVIAGTGPLEAEMSRRVSNDAMKSVTMIGLKSGNEVLELLKSSSFLVVSSSCYEVCPRVIVEAFACGVPVIVPSHGAFRDLVSDSSTGISFDPGNASDLVQKVQWAWDHPGEMSQMGENARREYEAKYTAEQNYAALIEIYKRALAEGVGVS